MKVRQLVKPLKQHTDNLRHSTTHVQTLFPLTKNFFFNLLSHAELKCMLDGHLVKILKLYFATYVFMLNMKNVAPELYQAQSAAGWLINILKLSLSYQ